MLARSRRIELAGARVETPLLVPSISSKAVGPIELGKGKKEELVAASHVHTDTFVPAIDEAVLISTYDIHHKLVANADAFRADFTKSLYASTRVLFLDSGWYEKSVGPASGQWYCEVGDSIPFEKNDYINVVDSLDSDIEAVLVNWDEEGTYLEQIEVAQDFFGGRTRFSADLLLKPEGTRSYHDFTELSTGTAARLRAFSIIGVTEKELGDTILRRLTTLAQLRKRLDEASVEAPIHVFGGLDPLASPLYFAAGAEVFDGLGWLRYAYRDGMSISREAVPLLDRHYRKRLPVATTHVQLKNLDELAELGDELKVFFHNGCEWTKLRHGNLLRPAFEAMESSLGRNNGR